MAKKIFTFLLTMIIVVSLFVGCSPSRENEILGTWEWTHDIDMGENIGTIHNFSKYVFEKKDGKYMATLTFSGLSSPITIEYLYKIEDLKLILTYLNDDTKVVMHDLVINESSLTIDNKEYFKINQ